MKCISVSLLAAFTILIGCGESDDQKDIDYVVAHKCVSDHQVMSIASITVVQSGKEVTIVNVVKPWYEYSCPNGLSVDIDVDKPQPPSSPAAK